MLYDTDVILLMGVLIWLAVVAYQDLCEQHVSPWLITIPTILVGIWRVVMPPADTWWPAGPAVCLILISVVYSSSPIGGVFILAALGLGIQASISTTVLLLMWTFAILLFGWGVWGGADAQGFMILTALWPNVWLSGALFGALLLGSSVATVRRFGMASPIALQNTMVRMKQGKRPSAETDTAAPLLPWMFLGTFGYVLWSVLL
jgi:hypothetical protein